MNKIVKSIASVTLAFGTVLGVSTTVLPIEDTAHAATKPYYVYNGYVDKDAKFVNCISESTAPRYPIFHKNREFNNDLVGSGRAPIASISDRIWLARPGANLNRSVRT